MVVTTFDGRPGDVKQYHVDWDVTAAEKGGYDYFMLKEIDEQPRALADTLLGRIGKDGRLHLDEMRLSDDELRDVDKVVIIACGIELSRSAAREVRDRALDQVAVRS